MTGKTLYMLAQRGRSSEARPWGAWEAAPYKALHQTLEVYERTVALHAAWQERGVGMNLEYAVYAVTVGPQVYPAGAKP